MTIRIFRAKYQVKTGRQKKGWKDRKQADRLAERLEQTKVEFIGLETISVWGYQGILLGRAGH